MTMRKTFDRTTEGTGPRPGGSPARVRRLLVVPAVAAAALAAAAGSSAAATTHPSAAAGGVHTVAAVTASTTTKLKTAKVGGVTVLTNAKGFTLYSFAPDTSTKSNCNGACAQVWPPVKGPATASGVKGKFATIKRSDGSVQATFKGHPLYTFTGDSAPRQAHGNGLNVNGGVWHVVTASGQPKHSGSSSSGTGGGTGY